MSLGLWENRQDSASQPSSPALPLGSCGSLKPHWVLVLMGPLLSPPRVTGTPQPLHDSPTHHAAQTGHPAEAPTFNSNPCLHQ